MHYLVRKSQLYRGLNVMKLKRSREASFAFTRAGNVKGLDCPGGEFEEEGGEESGQTREMH
jgi:hypothetical protein